MNNKKNIITSVILQIVTMVSGLILPRLVIITFGSEINGMVSSMTQFLSFISLLEGGLGAVVLSELYKPVIQGDDNQIRKILDSCQKFFYKLSIIFIVYTFIVAVIFSVIFRGKYSFSYTCSLVFILSFSTLIQYLFAITLKLLLQAQQKIYIVNVVSTCIIVINLVISVALVFAFPSIHVIKLFSGLLFLIQPLVLGHYVDNKYKGKIDTSEKYCLDNRWDGFAQNLAHFVNLNTDIIVITIFLSFIDVSVYSVYMLPITALRLIIASITNSYQSVLGKFYAEGDIGLLKKSFDKFDYLNKSISLVLFSTCIVLIDSFVKLYTLGVSDAEYYQPIFAIIIIIANMMFCIREPYRLLILAVGKFKETNFGAIMEAVINIIVSLLLVRKFGLIGIAVGTLVAIVYRFVYFVMYLKKNVLMKRYREYLGDSVKVSVIIAINVLIYFKLKFSINNYLSFVIYGILTVTLEGLMLYFLNLRIKINKHLKNERCN